MQLQEEFFTTKVGKNFFRTIVLSSILISLIVSLMFNLAVYAGPSFAEVAPALPALPGGAKPTIKSISPISAPANNSLILYVNGTNFLLNSVVNFQGKPQPTSYYSSTDLIAKMPASAIQPPTPVSSTLDSTARITVTNPDPNGGVSDPISLIITANPVPRITSISPTSMTVVCGLLSRAIEVYGTDFVPSSVVTFNGSDRETTYVSGTKLKAEITALDFESGKRIDVRVKNPSPGGGVSSQSSTLTLNNPPPTLTSILPKSAMAGSPDVIINLTGNCFVNGASAVSISSPDEVSSLGLSTTYVSPTQLTATIPASWLTVSKVIMVWVSIGSPGGGFSDRQTFDVRGPAPIITSVRAGYDLFVEGANFTIKSVINFDGLPQPTTFIEPNSVSPAMLMTKIPSAAGLYNITVTNPPPGGGVSNTMTFAVAQNSVPTIMKVDLMLGVLSVNGANFVPTSVVKLNGLARATAYNFADQLIVKEFIASGTYNVTVFNPSPGGGTSNAITITIPDSPTITSISPDSKLEGSADFTLTVNGTKFVPESDVSFNGVTGNTTYVSPTQLKTEIFLADLDPGIYDVKVVNFTNNTVSNTVKFEITSL